MPSLVQAVDLLKLGGGCQGVAIVKQRLMGLKENKRTSLQNFLFRKPLEWLAAPFSFEQIAETHFQQRKLDAMLQKTYSFSVLLSYREHLFAFTNTK